jgi:hypothetical protein
MKIYLLASEDEDNIDQVIVAVPDGTKDNAVIKDESVGMLLGNACILRIIENVADESEFSMWRAYTG